MFMSFFCFWNFHNNLCAAVLRKRGMEAPASSSGQQGETRGEKHQRKIEALRMMSSAKYLSTPENHLMNH